MSTDFVRSIIWPAIKIFLFAALVLLGVVFVPDAITGKVEQGSGSAVGYLRQQADRYLPWVGQDLEEQTQETKNDIAGLFSQIKEKYYPAAVDWISGKIKKF